MLETLLSLQQNMCLFQKNLRRVKIKVHILSFEPFHVIVEFSLYINLFLEEIINRRVSGPVGRVLFTFSNLVLGNKVK